MRNYLILSAPAFALSALVACGGAQKTGGSSGSGKNDVPPPPSLAKKGSDGSKAEPKHEISKDARKDYQSAFEFFATNDKGGWNEAACRAAADKFQAVARDHSDLVEAGFMVGLSFERCNLLSDAEKAYQAATHMKGDANKLAIAVSALGSIYAKQGKIDGATTYWQQAVDANGKLVGARIDLASLKLEQMRKINNPKDANWKKLDEDARFHLSNVLGVNGDSVEAYTVFALIYLEGYQTNKNRLDLAKLMLDEAKKRNEKYAPLQLAFGRYYLAKGRLNEALVGFNAAVEADPKFVEARINAGLLNLGFRKYDVAKEMFSKALEIAPKNYDAQIGLGIAQRGLNDYDGAEASYKKAAQIDSKQGDAYYNLGALYKGFRATHSADLPASIKAYQTAKDYFQQFLDKGDGTASDKTEAKNNIADCDKVVKQLQEFIKNQANNPPPPTAPAAPAAPAAAAPAAPPAK